QTTRRRIFGIANGDDYQLVLADLPGFQRPRDPLTERMQRTVDSSLEDVDAILFVLSARERIGAGDRFIAQRVFAAGVPVVIALTRDEVPHAITVEVEDVEGERIHANLLVETDSQKQILIGRGGAMIKEIGVRARPEVEALLGRHVFLELQVKVKPRWRRDESL